ncbi:MAG: SDR family oxidoreductase [Candidatus Micrarchaeia archaeon]
MRYLVTGASGFVGHYLCSRLASAGHAVIPATHSRKIGLGGEIQFDICNANSARKAISDSAPDAVIHCAAMTDVDECERQPALAEKINASAVEGICEAANSSGAKLVFLSTSFVFGSQGGILDEESRPLPINAYGTSKFHGESCVAEHSKDFLILRIDQPFGPRAEWQKQDMVAWTLSRARQGREFNVVSDWFNQPTYLPDLFMAMDSLIGKKQRGLFHCTGQERISRFEWARLIAKTYGIPPVLAKPVSASSLNLPALRPDVRLSCAKLAKITGLSPTPIGRALAELKSGNQGGSL